MTQVQENAREALLDRIEELASGAKPSEVKDLAEAWKQLTGWTLDEQKVFEEMLCRLRG